MKMRPIRKTHENETYKTHVKRPIRKTHEKRPIRKTHEKRPIRKTHENETYKTHVKRPIRKTHAKRPVRKTHEKTLQIDKRVPIRDGNTALFSALKKRIRK